MYKQIRNFTKIFKRDDSYEFAPIITEIEEKPINPLGRCVFWIVVFLIFTAVLILFFGKTDVVVSAPGKVIPDGNIKTIQPLSGGIIDTINVKEGDLVHKGDILININPSEINPSLDSALKTLAELKEEIKRLSTDAKGEKYNGNLQLEQDIAKASRGLISSSVQSKFEQTMQISEQIQGVESEITNTKNLLAQAIDRRARQEKVLDIISKEEYANTLSEISQYNSNINENKHKIKELNFKKRQIIEEINSLQHGFKKEVLNTTLERTKELNELEGKIKELEFKSSVQYIKAPIDGYINSLLVTTVGGVVTPAQELMTIVPIDSPLVIKTNIQSSEVGFIKEDMEVSIKIDTFDFQKYGMLRGKIRNISKDSIKDENKGYIYEVTITPLSDTLIVDGKEEKIKSGMTLMAEIKTGKRRIIEFFVYPLFKNLSESVSVK